MKVSPKRAIELFAGIGGLRLAAESVFPDLKVVRAVELDAIAQHVYQSHFPDTPMWSDIRDYALSDLSDFHDAPTIVFGGFPCRDTSSAGKRQGLDGEQSGLWWEFYRIIETTYPQFVIIENPRGLLARGLREILVALASIGYDAEWETISASSLGAPHVRDRVFIVAYPHYISRQIPDTQCGWAEQIRTEIESRGVHSPRPEALIGSSRGDDAIPSWLRGKTSAEWCEKWQPPSTPGRSKDCPDPESKLARWVNNQSINLYGLSCIPEQAEFAFRRVKYLAELVEQ
jgi:DNA (cytosine-5)-methyltransferase 1